MQIEQIIKGMPNWQDKINNNFTEVNNSVNDIESTLVNQSDSITSINTQLSHIMQDISQITSQSGIYKTLSKMQKNQSTYIITPGDSVTYGVKPHPSSEQVTNPYPALLQTKLQQIYNNSNITVENQGKSGWSTGTWIANNASAYYTNVINKNPDMIILMLGINDVQSGVSLEIYEANLTQLIKIAIDNGIEVLLLSPTMVKVKNDWAVTGVKDVNSLVYGYSKTCKKISDTFNTGFIDMQSEFINLFYNTNLYLPSDIINSNDFVHPTDLGYKFISEIVVKGIQDMPVLILDGEKSIAAVGCPFIESNMQIAQTTNGTGLRFNDTYIINTGQYLKLRFLVIKNNLSLSILKAISYFGSNIDILLDGTLLKTLTSNDSNLESYGSTTKYNVKEFITDLTPGYHEIIFQNPTKTGVSTTFYFLISAFIFELNNEPKVLARNKMFALENNVFTHLNTNQANDLICLKTGKKLVIHCKGYFLNSAGLIIFNTIGLTSGSESVSNFVSFASGKIQLTTYNINSGTPSTTIGTNTQDFTKELDIRIEIDSSYNFNIYVNNILELTATNTQNTVKGGLLELLNQSGSTVNTMINDLSWCYY